MIKTKREKNKSEWADQVAQEREGNQTDLKHQITRRMERFDHQLPLAHSQSNAFYFQPKHTPWRG